jgi:uncharacterized protein (DUF2235 family)
MKLQRLKHSPTRAASTAAAAPAASFATSLEEGLKAIDLDADPAATVRGPRPKNIVVCSDGTGNADIRGRGTNVFKLFEAVELRANQHHLPNQRLPPDYDHSPPTQTAIYHDGLGTESFKPIRLIGAAFGYGFSRHVKQLYTELARCYVPGDKIFLFGFSRGAFTVRSLAGLIAHTGLLDVKKVKSEKELNQRVNEAYTALRECFRRFGTWRKDPVNNAPAEAFRKNYAVEPETPIEFLGVWDTVDAVGFPLDEIADLWNTVVYPFKFPDTNLSSVVKCARHAISIDDARRTFHPELWNESPDSTSTRRIVQVWFPGVHSNVGGGYPKQGISLVSMVWMMKEAETRGLRFVQSMRRQYKELQNVHDKLYDSRAGLAGYYAYKPRDMKSICAKYSATPRIHVSTFERISLGTDGYAPGNLAWPADVVRDQLDVDVPALDEVVHDAFDKGRARLRSARKWIVAWRWSQGLFIFLSVLIVVLHARDFGWSAVTDLSTITGYVNIVKTLIGYPLVTLGAILTFIACYRASAMLGRTYSAFWFCHRERLRSVLSRNTECLQGPRVE